MELHPWNRAFRWQTPRGPYRRVTQDQARAFNEQGFFVLPDVFTPEEIAEVVAEIDPFEAQTEAFLKRLDGERISIAEAGAITFTIHLVTRSAKLKQFARHPVFADLCHDLIGPDARLYWDQAVYKKPDKPRRFPWHQDNGYTFVEPQQYLTCWVALTDATVDNGCPWVVPGAHLQGTLAHRYIEPLGWECLTEPEGAVAAPVAAGGIVVFSSLTPHLTGPNTSAAVRKSYILQYAPEGARVQRGDPKQGPPESSETCDAPDRQFPILVDAERVA